MVGALVVGAGGVVVGAGAVVVGAEAAVVRSGGACVGLLAINMKKDMLRLLQNFFVFNNLITCDSTYDRISIIVPRQGSSLQTSVLMLVPMQSSNPGCQFWLHILFLVVVPCEHADPESHSPHCNT